MTGTLPTRPAGRFSRPVGWVLGVFALLMLLAGWGALRAIGHGLSPREPAPRGSRSEQAVRESEATAGRLSRANADGTLTDAEIKAGLGTGVLIRVTRGSDSADVSVGFPYTYTRPPATRRYRGYVCVDYRAWHDKPVEKRYVGGCPSSLTDGATATAGR